MTKKISVLPRHQLSTIAWDACVAASAQRILYGYSWYLDAVLPAPNWKWIGLVLTNEAGGYRAVMPVPLRRKTVAGFTYEWVVHQPFFCQFLSVFSRDALVDTGPFFREMLQHVRYGSVFCSTSKPDERADFDLIQSQSTQILNLSVSYPAIYQSYTTDRKVNLRRAEAGNWIIKKSTDLEPLLFLFRENHADQIEGGVAEWAYSIFRSLVSELQKRELATLHYAMRDDTIEAGALFLREGNRIIYLFNAASETGRRGNARTLLVDTMIRESAGQQVVLDFESPEKASIRAFYSSFGAAEEPIYRLRWNRLNWVEKLMLTLKER